MSIRIESGIPVPPRVGGGGRPGKYPFEHMTPGDSFLVTYQDGQPPAHAARRLASATKGASKRTGFKFTTRRLKDGVRVWRVE